jgi:hypothetical protein
MQDATQLQPKIDRLCRLFTYIKTIFLVAVMTFVYLFNFVSGNKAHRDRKKTYKKKDKEANLQVDIRIGQEN